MPRFPLYIVGLLASSAAVAQVPSYRVEPIATLTTLTAVNGANEVGQFVGYQLVSSQSRPYVASASSGLTLLPLPTGSVSGFASDINDWGVIVGTVSSTGFASTSGEPAIWTPNDSGGYDVTVPQQFTTLPGPFGNMPIDGGQAVAINNQGTIVGWSRYQGYQGGPTTQFSLTGPPVNLAALGFAATVRDMNDQNVIVGGQLRMDLDTGVVVNLGVPPQSGGPHYSFVIAYSVNNQNETVVAAQQATSSSNWVTFYHSDAAGYTQLNPSVVPSPIVGRYDNNDNGDIAAQGGVLFRAEGVLVGGFDGLLEPASVHWDTTLGEIANDRRVYTTAYDTQQGVNALVQLVPEGPGTNYCGPAVANSTGLSAQISAAGSSAVADDNLTLRAAFLPQFTTGLFIVSMNQGHVPNAGGSTGTLCIGAPAGRFAAQVQGSGAAGEMSIDVSLVVLPQPTGPVTVLPGQTWNFQCWFRDSVGGMATSNFTDGISITFH